MSPRPSLADERRPQILAAASRVIAERGFAHTRLSDVAEAAGVSIGVVQHYFGSRENLLTESFTHDTSESIVFWQAAGAAASGTPWERLVALVDRAMLDAERFRWRWALWLEFWAACVREPALRAQMAVAYAGWRAPIERAMADGIESGLFTPRLALDDIVDRTIASLDGLALQVLVDAPGMSPERMRSLLVAALAHDLGIDERMPAGPVPT